jgi:hypothetical protein
MMAMDGDVWLREEEKREVAMVVAEKRVERRCPWRYGGEEGAWRIRWTRVVERERFAG